MIKSGWAGLAAGVGENAEHMKMGVGAGTMRTVRPEVQQREQAEMRSIFQLCEFANENTARCLQ